MACGNQRTVGSPASLAGTSLHTGQPVTLTLKPAPADFGIKFRRVDIPDQPFISADVEKVQTVERATSLAEGSVKVHTVEHILSALTGMGIDNAVIEMDANEPPIGDGSSAPYVELIKSAGIVELDVPRRYLEVREAVTIETKGGSILTILPSKQFRVSVTCVGPETASPSTLTRSSRRKRMKRNWPRPAPLRSTKTSSPCWKRASSRAAAWKTPWSSAARSS